MQIRYHCPQEGCVAIIQYEPLKQCGESMECPRCHKTNRMFVSDEIRQDNTVDACVVCNCKELFIRKDFPQALGLTIVVVFGLAAIYYFRTNVLFAWSILGAAIIIDLLIYAVLGRVTTCYACRAEYRKAHLNPNHDGFDLAKSEKY